MQNHDATSLLKEKIQQKENELAVEAVLLRNQFALTIESLKPINMIKEALTSSEVKTTVLDTAIGMTSGFIAKKALVRSSKNSFVQLLGTMVGVGVANVMTKHPYAIKFIGEKILNKVFKNKTIDKEEV